MPHQHLHPLQTLRHHLNLLHHRYHQNLHRHWHHQRLLLQHRHRHLARYQRRPAASQCGARHRRSAVAERVADEEALQLREALDEAQRSVGESVERREAAARDEALEDAFGAMYASRPPAGAGSAPARARRRGRPLPQTTRS